MGAFKSMGSINSRADQAVHHIMARSQRGAGIRGIEGIDIHPIIDALLLGKINEMLAQLRSGP